MYRLFIDTPHLIFQIHDTQADGSLVFPVSDVLVLRKLAERYAEIAALPVQEERKRMWRRLNDLEPERPLIWVNEVCWNEMDHDGNLRLLCSNEVCRRIETYQHRSTAASAAVAVDGGGNGGRGAPWLSRGIRYSLYPSRGRGLRNRSCPGSDLCAPLCPGRSACRRPLAPA
jgi:hypothetical protein